MATLQSRLEQLRQQLEDPGLYQASRSAEAQTLLREQASAKSNLARAEEAWLKAGEELEQLEQAKAS